MMITAKPMETINDAELVGASIAGNRDAFGQIVARYQSLVCSLAYSATGSLSQSEDLAQETFIAAWKQMAELREPMKLRAWLCGIARNLINNALRRQGREPSHKAESLEEISDSAAPGPLPAEQSINNEEQAILWRSLERIPEIYREPLVLFYREHQSIQAVALSLDLNEDAVKQRLSRGRKLLHEQVLAFVERALEKTSPGRAFTLGVLAALPMAATSAKAVTVGAALATGGATAKSAMTVGALGGLLAFLGSIYYSIKSQTEDTKSPRERNFVLQMMGGRVALGIVYFAIFFTFHHFKLLPDLFDGRSFESRVALAGLIFSVCVLSVFLVEFTAHRRRIIQMEEGNFQENEWKLSRKLSDPKPVSKTEYFRSARFKALILVMVAMTFFMKLWTLPWLSASALLIVWLLCWYLDYHRWRNSPRFEPKGGDAALYLSGGFCFFTFLQLYFQNISTATLGTPIVVSPSASMAFNAVVIVAYVLLIGVTLWYRKKLAGKLPPAKSTST